MPLKEYARCCVKNKVTLGGIISGSLFANGLINNTEYMTFLNETMDYLLFMGAFAGGLCTQFGLVTYDRYERVKKALENRDSPEYIEKNIVPDRYCDKQGYKLALKDHQRKQSRK